MNDVPHGVYFRMDGLEGLRYVFLCKLVFWTKKIEVKMGDNTTIFGEKIIGVNCEL